VTWLLIVLAVLALIVAACALARFIVPAPKRRRTVRWWR
jgi:hypothetical protein